MPAAASGASRGDARGHGCRLSEALGQRRATNTGLPMVALWGRAGSGSVAAIGRSIMAKKSKAKKKSGKKKKAAPAKKKKTLKAAKKKTAKKVAKKPAKKAAKKVVSKPKKAAPAPKPAPAPMPEPAPAPAWTPMASEPGGGDSSGG